MSVEGLYLQQLCWALLVHSRVPPVWIRVSWNVLDLHVTCQDQVQLQLCCFLHCEQALCEKLKTFWMQWRQHNALIPLTEIFRCTCDVCSVWRVGWECSPSESSTVLEEVRQNIKGEAGLRVPQGEFLFLWGLGQAWRATALRQLPALQSKRHRNSVSQNQTEPVVCRITYP